MGRAPSKSGNTTVINSFSSPQPAEKAGLAARPTAESQPKTQQLIQQKENQPVDVNANSSQNTSNYQEPAKSLTSPKKAAPKTVKQPVEKVKHKSSAKPIDTVKLTDISYEEASKLTPTNPEEMWAIVKGTSDKEGIHLEPTKNRKGWRTIRIFVSSTFKDFHQEREVLVKEVGDQYIVLLVMFPC